MEKNYHNLRCQGQSQFLPAATKLGQGNVFTGICDSVHREGCLPQCMLGCHPPRSRHPREQTPPWEQTPPRSRHPPRADTPMSRYPPQEADPPEQSPPRAADTPPGSRHPPRSRHPPEADHPLASRHPPGSRLQHMVNERPVRILLECILVVILNTFTPRGMLDPVNFGYFVSSRCERFHCNTMQTSIKAHINWREIQQIEYTPVPHLLYYQNVRQVVLHLLHSWSVTTIPTPPSPPSPCCFLHLTCHVFCPK